MPIQACHLIMFPPTCLSRNVLSLHSLRVQTHRHLELVSKNAPHVTRCRPYSSSPEVPGQGAGRDRAAVGVCFIFLFYVSFVLMSRSIRSSHQKLLHCSLHPALACISTSATRKSNCSCNVVCLLPLFLILLIIDYTTRRKRARSQNNRPSTRRRPIYAYDTS